MLSRDEMLYAHCSFPPSTIETLKETKIQIVKRLSSQYVYHAWYTSTNRWQRRCPNTHFLTFASLTANQHRKVPYWASQHRKVILYRAACGNKLAQGERTTSAFNLQFDKLKHTNDVDSLRESKRQATIVPWKHGNLNPKLSWCKQLE